MVRARLLACSLVAAIACGAAAAQDSALPPVNTQGAISYVSGGIGADESAALKAAQPNYPLARFHLGRILVNQEKYGEAIQQLHRALTPEDEQTSAYLYALGAAYARAGDRELARTYIQKARDAAVARGQSKLLTGIDRDLKALDGQK